MRGEPEEISYLELATQPSAPFWARRQTIASLKAWQLWPETIEIAELLVSELVTNAVQVSGPSPGQLAASSLDGVERISLTLRLLPGRLVIEVFDNDHNRAPVLTNADEDAENGRGLLLVQALSREWGHYNLPSGGKKVYAVLGIPYPSGQSDTAQPWQQTVNGPARNSAARQPHTAPYRAHARPASDSLAD